MDNTIETKLNRVDAAVSTIKQNLHFEDNALIEDVAASTDIKRLTNVFVQQNEPAVKDGIWVQCDEKANAFDKIIMDREMIIPYKWQLLNQHPKLSNIKVLNAPDSWLMVNGKVFRYDWGCKSYTLSNNNGTFAQHQSWRVESSSRDSIATDGTNVYVGLGGYSSSKVFSVNNGAEVTGYPNFDHVSHVRYNSYDNSLYACGYYYGYKSKGIIKLDLATKSIAEIYKDTSVEETKVVPLGNRLLCIAAEKGKSYMLDISSVPALKVNDAPVAIQDIYVPAEDGWGILDMPDHFYIYNGLNSIVKYNKDTLEAEDMTEAFKDSEIQNLYSLMYYDNKFWCIHGPSFDEVYLAPMETMGKVYHDNAVLISQAPISKTEHQTALWTYDGLEGRMTQSFYDIFYYDKEKGYMKDYPIYYGNGIEWIKFKN
jgi:hypothetical protein